MTTLHSWLFRDNIHGKTFSAFQNSGSVLQSKLLNGTLHNMNPAELKNLLEQEPDALNPLKTRKDLGLAFHPDTLHWPLCACVLARIFLEENAGNRENLQNMVHMLREWEKDVVVAAAPAAPAPTRCTTRIGRPVQVLT